MPLPANRVLKNSRIRADSPVTHKRDRVNSRTCESRPCPLHPSKTLFQHPVKEHRRGIYRQAHREIALPRDDHAHPRRRGLGGGRRRMAAILYRATSSFGPPLKRSKPARATAFLRSLFRGPNSLFWRINSLFGLKKFPVPVCREFSRKYPKVRTELGLKSSRKTSDSRKFPVFFPVSRELVARRRVHDDWHPPNLSLQGSREEPSSRPKISANSRGLRGRPI